MVSAFEYSKFEFADPKDVDADGLNKRRQQLVQMARISETAERYDDMCQFMRELVDYTTDDLTVEERNLLSVAYKNVIGARRASWRTLNVDEHKDSPLLKTYKQQVEAELQEICDEVLSLLEKLLSRDLSETNESQVFYLKMTGDYYRYLAEFVSEENQGYPAKAAENYGKALDIAKTSLLATHPIRLGLALNYSVCYYEILKNPEKACQLAKQAFDDAISKLDTLDETSYKDSTLIMQLLRDNLTLWTSGQVEDVEEEE